jgi:myo-inositol-1(or 4)-monophosphatase
MLGTAKKAAKEAGKILLSYYNNLSLADSELKKEFDFVSKADKEAELCIKKILLDQFSNDLFLGEEENEAIDLEALDKDQTIWVVDPLDGTTNFLKGIPAWAVSIAAVNALGPVLGLIYNPLSGDLYTAQKGKGSFHNGNSINVSGQASLKGAFLAFGSPFRSKHEMNAFMQLFENIQNLAGDQRRMGSAALDCALVASGSLDGFWETGLGPWDIAAGTLLIEEAGGWTGDYLGENSKLRRSSFLLTNGKIQNEVLNFTRQYPEEFIK